MLLPTIVNKENTGLLQSDPYSNAINKDFTVFINEAITNEVYLNLRLILGYLNSKDPERLITIEINSPGGDVLAGLAIYDYVHSLSNPIRTIGRGLCASMASFLLTTLATEKRMVSKNCQLLYHQPLMNHLSGQATDISIATEQILKLKKNLYKILSKHSDYSIKELNNVLERDYWIPVEKAVKKKLVDEII